MKIIDSFIFYNELDILEYRLNILNDVVDYFILVEAKHTFIGKPKPLFFEENKERYEKFKDKIIHIVVDNLPYIYPNINIQHNQQWENESYQRNCIQRGLDKLQLNDNDLIIIADTDEIPDPSSLFDIIKNNIEINSNSLRMSLYYYNLNSQMKFDWYTAKIVSYKYFKELNMPCNSYRISQSNSQFPIIEKGGWHLSYFGDSAFIQNKLENFSHQEYNNLEFTDINRIESRVNGFTDLFDRNYINISKVSVKENQYLPPKYNIYLSKFVNF